MSGQDVILDNPAFIHPTALILGKAHLKEGSSMWPYSVIRGDMHDVVIGKYSNVQDFVMIHIGMAKGTYVGDYCSITHHVTLHGCNIGNNCLIGINATIMEGCEIGDNSIVLGHTYLKEGTVIPENSIVSGIPGQVTKTRNCRIENIMNALGYYENGLGFAKGDQRSLTRIEVLTRIQENLMKMM